MSLHRIIELYQFFWMFESHAQQRLARAIADILKKLRSERNA